MLLVLGILVLLKFSTVGLRGDLPGVITWEGGFALDFDRFVEDFCLVALDVVGLDVEDFCLVALEVVGLDVVGLDVVGLGVVVGIGVDDWIP